MGTSSIPFGLIIAGMTPRPLGSQSEFAATVSWSLTSASVLGTPTLNCTVITDKPVWETEVTCSTPVI